MFSKQSFAIRLLEHLVTPAFVLDTDGLVIVWNRAMENLTGIPRREMLGTRNHWQAFYDEARDTLADLVLKGNNSDLSHLYDTHLVSGEPPNPTINAENWCVMPALKERKYLCMDAGPVSDEEGNLVAVVETIRDMTELKNIQESLQRMAISDVMTGLGNRRFFDSQLQTCWYSARRQSLPLSLLLLDVDYFKRYNDHYGHPAGDHVLSRVGLVLSTTTLRGDDQCFRYGGEEFAILLPDTDAQGAFEVAERIRERIFALNVEHKGSPALQRLSASIGVHTLTPSENEDPNDLLRGADQALYEAKARGRNCTIHFEELPKR